MERLVERLEACLVEMLIVAVRWFGVVWLFFEVRGPGLEGGRFEDLTDEGQAWVFVRLSVPFELVALRRVWLGRRVDLGWVRSWA